MTKKKINEVMENMNLPHVDVSEHQRVFNLTLLNTRKSAIAGVVLLILPLFFLTGVLFKHLMGLHIPILTGIYEWIGEMDRSYGGNSILNWAIRFLLLVGPLLAIGINFLSVIHIRYEKTTREIILSLKLKWLNWTIIILCSFIFMVFFLYLIVENTAA